MRPTAEPLPAPSFVGAGIYDAPMRGDRVEITVDVGNGVQTFEVVATRAGRRVEVTTGRTMTEVTEVTRGGTAVRTARFLTARVVALVEHPAG
jgi:hypothetical protein